VCGGGDGIPRGSKAAKAKEKQQSKKINKININK
jgi:hypothetical protein